MKFKADRDFFYNNWMVKVSINCTLAFILPFIIYKPSRTPIFILVTSVSYVLSMSHFVLPKLFIEYEFRDDYFYVKGWPYRSKIQYSDITMVTDTCDIYKGFRLMTAKEGVEIFYKNGWRKSVKISPKDQELFLGLLKYRSPHVDILIEDL